MNNPRKLIGIAILGSSIACASMAYSEMKEAPSSSSNGLESSETMFKNGWLEGKLETSYLLNSNLNNFTIDAEVDGSNAVLNGSVKSEIDKDLAEEIALSIDGIDSVDNKLTVDPEQKKSMKDGDSQFVAAIDDATISAKVKMKLMANDNISSMAIDVDTDDNIVTLKGEVKSKEQKDLAEYIAKNVAEVKKVENHLTVSPS